MPKLLATLDKRRARMMARGISLEGPNRSPSISSYYGFPESHAWSFALIAYATAWLKAYQPAAFYAGILNAWPMDFYSPATLVHDANVTGQKFDILAWPWAWDCTIEETHALKRPPSAWGRHIRGIEARGRNRLQCARTQGPFTSITDVVHRPTSRLMTPPPEGGGAVRAVLRLLRLPCS